MATFGTIREKLNNILTTAAEKFGKGGLDDQDIKTGKLVCQASNSIAGSIHAELRARDHALSAGKKAEDIGALGSMSIS